MDRCVWCRLYRVAPLCGKVSCANQEEAGFEKKFVEPKRPVMMIREEDASELLRKEFPGIHPELEKTGDSSSIYKNMRCFAVFTKKVILAGNLEEVKHCFAIAENLWKEGNQTVKSTIENVFVFSISQAIDLTEMIGNNIKSLLCVELRNEYKRQTAEMT